MRYRIVGEEMATHRHVEIPNWDAPDVAAARRFATEIGIAVSKIERMDGQVRREPEVVTPPSAPVPRATESPLPTLQPPIFGEPPTLKSLIVTSLVLLAAIVVVMYALRNLH